MKTKLATSQFSWLWKLAILFYCQFLFCQLFFETSDAYNIKYGDSSLTSPFVFILVFILIPPFIEEIIFRGIHTKGKISIVLSIIFYLGSTLMLFYNGLKIWWLLMILTPFVILFVIKINTSMSKGFIIIYSTFLFTLAHYSNEITLQEFILNSGNYLAAGFFLSWVVINYNLFKSILVHLAYNTLVLSFFILFSDKTFIESKNENITYSIEQISLFNKSKSISRTSNSLIAKQANLSVILSHLEIPKGSNIYIESPISKFNIKIYDQNDGLEDKEILDIFVRTKIIEVR